MTSESTTARAQDRRPAKDVSPQEFEELVADGLDMVPPELMAMVDNVVF